MATLIVTEFAQMTQDANNQLIPVGELDSVIASTAVTYSSSTQHTLDKRTRFVRLIADEDCHVKGGQNPTATVDDPRLEANVAEYFGVQPKGTTGTKIAAYDGVS